MTDDGALLRSQNADRKSSGSRAIADALLKYANKNDVAHLANLALLADLAAKQKTGFFASFRRFAA